MFSSFYIFSELCVSMKKVTVPLLFEPHSLCDFFCKWQNDFWRRNQTNSREQWVLSVFTFSMLCLLNVFLFTLLHKTHKRLTNHKNGKRDFSNISHSLNNTEMEKLDKMFFALFSHSSNWHFLMLLLRTLENVQRGWLLLGQF